MNQLLTKTMAILAIGAGMSSCAQDKAVKERPNIILIMTDDQGFETVGIYGGESYKTPVLDKLAETGIRFDQCHAAPVCTPTRVMLMSGKYNSRNYTGFGVMDPEIYTFGNLFQEAGYATFIAGKWQLAGGFDAPYAFGFDEYALWQVTKIGNRYPNPALAINGKKVHFLNGEYGPDITNEYVMDFMDRNRENPFFIYYPMILPHFPFEPVPDSPDWDPTARRGDNSEQKGINDKKYFGDMIEYTDKLVGQIIDKLDELELREKTLVIYISDNGTEKGITSIHNGEEYKGGKLTSKDAGTHVPFIANWKGVIPEGLVNDDLICFTYFFPSLAEIAGIKIPGGLELDGQSFAPLLYGKKTKLPDWIYMWWYRNNDPSGPGDEFARTHRYKYYHDGRFYDLTEDPLEDNPIPLNELNNEQKGVQEKLTGIINKYTRQGYYESKL